MFAAYPRVHQHGTHHRAPFPRFPGPPGLHVCGWEAGWLKELLEALSIFRVLTKLSASEYPAQTRFGPVSKACLERGISEVERTELVGWVDGRFVIGQ